MIGGTFFNSLEEYLEKVLLLFATRLSNPAAHKPVLFALVDTNMFSIFFSEKNIMMSNKNKKTKIRKLIILF